MNKKIFILFSTILTLPFLFAFSCKNKVKLVGAKTQKIIPGLAASPVVDKYFIQLQKKKQVEIDLVSLWVGDAETGSFVEPWPAQIKNGKVLNKPIKDQTGISDFGVLASKPRPKLEHQKQAKTREEKHNKVSCPVSDFEGAAILIYKLKGKDKEKKLIIKAFEKMETMYAK